MFPSPNLQVLRFDSMVERQRVCVDSSLSGQTESWGEYGQCLCYDPQSGAGDSRKETLPNKRWEQAPPGLSCAVVLRIPGRMGSTLLDGMRHGQCRRLNAARAPRRPRQETPFLRNPSCVVAELRPRRPERRESSVCDANDYAPSSRTNSDGDMAISASPFSSIGC